MPVSPGKVKGFGEKGPNSPKSKGIFHMADNRVLCLRSLGGFHLHHVKPGLKGGWIFRQIELGGGAQLILLAPIHKLPCPAVSSAFAQLDLHKAEVTPVGGDEVDLPKAAPPPGSQNGVALLP